MKRLIGLVLRRFHFFFSTLLFDPLELVNKWRALPFFARNLARYYQLNTNRSFKFRLAEMWYRSHDRFASAGTAEGHYFYQDLWAARLLLENHVKEHVDVGSRLDGFVGHILPFCRVCYVDIRPLNVQLEGFEFRRGSILEMPFEDNSISSLSSLHVIEHVGLGRYGDRVEPDGYVRAAKELARVLAPNGCLLLGTPVGKERLCFDAHRIFDPQTVVDAFGSLRLVEFSLIDDKGQGILRNATFDQAKSCSYGCGLFVFKKDLTVR